MKYSDCAMTDVTVKRVLLSFSARELKFTSTSTAVSSPNRRYPATAQVRYKAPAPPMVYHVMRDIFGTVLSLSSRNVGCTAQEDKKECRWKT